MLPIRKNKTKQIQLCRFRTHARSPKKVGPTNYNQRFPTCNHMMGMACHQHNNSNHKLITWKPQSPFRKMTLIQKWITFLICSLLQKLSFKFLIIITPTQNPKLLCQNRPYKPHQMGGHPSDNSNSWGYTFHWKHLPFNDHLACFITQSKTIYTSIRAAKNSFNTFGPKIFSAMAELENPNVMTNLITFLSSLLQKVAESNDVSCRFQPQKISVFHGLTQPTISIQNYLDRIYKYANCSPSCFIVAYVYLDRFAQRQPSLPINSFNVHRMLITSVMVAAKFMDDM